MVRDAQILHFGSPLKLELVRFAADGLGSRSGKVEVKEDIRVLASGTGRADCFLRAFSITDPEFQGAEDLQEEEEPSWI